MANSLLWVKGTGHEISDDFTSDTNVNLNAHTTAEGYAWVSWNVGVTVGEIDVNASTDRTDNGDFTSTQPELYYVDKTISTANYKATIDFLSDSTAADEASIGIRFSYTSGSTSHSAYYLTWFPDLAEARVYKVISGTSTLITGGFATTGLGPHNIEISMTGQTLSAKWNTVSVYSGTQTDIANPGKVAIGAGFRLGRAQNTAIHYDNLVVDLI